MSYVNVEGRYAPLWWQTRGLSYTASGYGKAIPTAWKVRYAGRWRRVYCTIFSNAGTCWVPVKGQKHVVNGSGPDNFNVSDTPWR